jgi:hypothetical protein|tara:strand:- start:11955 stop:12212 length:258 start_codon:yes stop_codon:yes gene_type:complete
MGKINEYSAGTVDANVNLLGSGSSATEPTKQFKINDINTYFMGTKVSVPATAGATGTAGDYAVESGYAYFCVATDTWERVAIATW